MDKKEKPGGKGNGGGAKKPQSSAQRTTTRKGQPQFCSRCGGEGHTRNSKKCPRLGGGR